MVKKKKVFGAGNGLKRFPAWWKDVPKFFLLFCIALFLAGCASMPTENEIVTGREEAAKQDLLVIRPVGINFEAPLTLEDCIQIGLRNNLKLRVADFDKEIASKETLAEKLRMLPGLTIDGRYEYRDKLRKSDVYNWKTDQDQPDYTVSELKDSGRANLSLTWNVIDTVLAYVRSDKAEMYENVLEKRHHRQAQFLALDITEAYWQAAAVEDALDYVHTVERKLKVLKRNIDSAVKLRALDIMSAKEAEMRLKELELTIRKLQARLSKARLNLSEYMGLNQNVEFTLYRAPIKPVVAALPHTRDLDIDRLEEYALTHRPDLFETDMNVRMQKQAAKEAFWKLFPGVNFFAASHYDANRLLLSNTWNSVGAGIGWNLLDLPSRIIEHQASGKAVNMAEVQRLMLTVGVITQVHIALLDYAIKVDRFRLLEDTYVLSADLLDMAKEKKAVGKLPALAVTQRHLEEMAAKLRRDEAVVDLIVAHKRLCVAVGIDPLECDSSGICGARSGGMADTSPLKRWKCTECGYIHTGPRPPDTCPICGASRSQFVEYSGEKDELIDDVGNWGSRGGGEPIIRSESADILSRSAPSPLSDRFASDASDSFLWKLQVGAFSKQEGVAKRIAQIKNAELRLLDPRDMEIETKRVSGLGLINRVRFKGLTQADAKNMSNELRRKGMEYWIIPPHSAHW